MSYDLQVWTTQSPSLPDCLPDDGRWVAQGDTWAWARREWQVVAGPVHVVDAEDIPDDVQTALPGVSHMVEFNLEPLGAPPAAYALLERAAKALARQAHGAVADPQAGTVATPTGVRRWVSQPRSQVVTALALSWFSVDDVLASREGIERVLDAFERHVPEAMPVRYGQWEPLSFRYADHGRQHLVDFLADEYLMPGSLGFALLKPKRPVFDVELSLARNRRSPGLPWACHRVTVTLDAAVLDQGGWATALRRLWRRLTHDVQAFFADVRVIRGYRLGSGSEEEWRAAGRHPVCGNFWMGIPREPALALALGPPYLARWSEFSRVAEHEGTHALATPPRWTLDGDALAMVGPVPERLAKQCAGYAESGPNRSPTYPAEWPFGRPPTPGG